MGNQISRHADPIDDSREGVMPEFTFTETARTTFRVTRAVAIPTWMDITPKLRLIDLATALRDAETTAARARSTNTPTPRSRHISMRTARASEGMTISSAAQ